ncbi:MAG: hypothetical protein AAF591_10225 [Verrucomicrobiota bacterium]
MKAKHEISKLCSIALAIGMVGGTGGLSAANEVNGSIEQLGILPGDKAPLLVTVEERNPFSARVEEKQDDAFGLSSESQESQIRAVFGSLRVNGLSKAPQGGLRVLLGDLILTEGQEVAPVIVGQTERIVVVKVTEEEIEFAWVDEHTNELDGRTLSIPILMAPSVEFELAGQQAGRERSKVRGVRVYVEEKLPKQGAVPNEAIIKKAEKVASLGVPEDSEGE